MDMEVLAAEGSISSDGMKDDKPAKLNGELNGSVERMDIDEDSGDGADVATDESVYGSSRAPDADGDPEDPNSRFGSEIDGKSTSHFESEGEGDGDAKTPSHFGSEYGAKSDTPGMDVDGLEDADGDADGHSVNSEEEFQLLNSDTEDEKAKSISAPESKVSAVDEVTEHEVVTEEEDDDEEGDINEGVDSVNVASPKETIEDDGKADSNDEDDASSNKGEDAGTPEKVELAASEVNGPTAVTPEKKKKKKSAEPITPRRSSRTVQKPQRFGVDGDEEEEEGENEEEMASDDGGEEVTSADPLADPIIDKENRRFPRMIGNTTIVMSDSKRATDLSVRAQPPPPKKEPTLVIIDTNSILSGRGGIPMQTAGGVTITQQPSPHRPQPAHLPQATITPPRPKPPPPILPTLTDDMYVVEAPSFIVPYVYEKPPVKKFKKYLRKMIKEVRRQEDEEERLEKEAEEREANEKNAPKSDTVEVKKEVTDSAETEIKEEKIDIDDAFVKKEISEDKIDVDQEAVKKEPSDEKMDVEEPKRDEVKPEVKKPEEETDPLKTKEDDDDDETETDDDSADDEKKKKPPGSGSYFDNPLGKFFMQIGMNLVQEFVQTDLLKQQKKRQKAGKGNEETQAAITSLKKNLIMSKENNQPYTMEQTKCEFCSFKTESKLIMAHHLETPHMRNYVYRCNFCPLEVRGPHDILYHMEAEHCVRGRLERAPAFHQCPQCPFEDNQKGKLTRHLMTCGKKFRPEKNLEPPLDWEPPAKIPRLPRKPNSMAMNVNNPLYSQAMAKNLPAHLLPKAGGVGVPGNPASPLMRAGRGRPAYPQMPTQAHKILGQRAPLPPSLQRANMMYRNPAAPSSGGPPGSSMLPSGYSLTNNPLYQVMGPAGLNLPGGATLPTLQRLGLPPQTQQKSPATVKLLNQPSISITPLPRQSAGNPQPGIPPVRPGAAPAANSKTTFVICEICDGYIKDLEQLRNHMQWIHKVKIHPKMIYNRPPLNCQKCQFRFFTDQGLERHLLGSHGLVTSSMQDQANRGKDGGRCPVCGRVYQWKLLNHVARDHNMTLKPAHLSYKCTVCTATFGMYKQFESHVYSAHSVVAKRVMDKKNGQAPSTSRNDSASLLKPLKINDEITIIPQPAKKPATAQRPVPGNYRVGANLAKSRGPDSVQVIDLEDSPNKAENGSESLTAVKERLKRRQSLEIRQLESDGEDSGSEADEGVEVEPQRQTRPQDDEDDDEDDQPTEGESD